MAFLMRRNTYSFPPKIIERKLSGLMQCLIYKKKLLGLGKNSFISLFSQLNNMNCIRIGDDCFVNRGVMLDAVVCYEGEMYEPQITIGNNVYIGKNVTISSVNSIIIKNGVAIGDNVYIADGRHGYEDIHEIVFLKQKLVILGKLEIGEGSWIGAGAFIAGGISVGNHSVIGANSVVISDVPSYTVVAGIPARVIKKYDFKESKWIKV